uniref:Cytoplasmic dynein 2 heavy chain 1 n=1 Tax=Ditylenchus dipsaci TaxID=166011 RepID=A0A915E882_9BILA
MAESRRYLLRVASHILSLNLVEDKLPNVQALFSFCDTPTSLLVISRVDQKGHVDVGNELNSSKAALFRVVFYKSRAAALSKEDYKSEVTVLTIHQNAKETFLGSVQQVFSKLVNDSSHKDDRLKNTSDASTGETGKGVSSLEDEITIWAKNAQKDKDPGSYSEALEPLAEQMNSIKNSAEKPSFATMDELFGLLRRQKNVWMHCGTVWTTPTLKLSPAAELWNSNLAVEALRNAISLCNQWIETVDMLTSKTWPSNALNDWKGAPMQMDFFSGFKERLEEIFSLRTLGDQLVGLLQEPSLRAEIQSSIESAMKGFNACLYTTSTDPAQWKSRLNTAERSLDSLVERTIPLLKTKLEPSSKADLNQILEDLYAFKNFFTRKSVLSKLQIERETFVSRLQSHLSTQKKEFNDHIRLSTTSIGKFLTEIASKIIWIRANIIQVEKLKKYSQPLLADLASYKRLEQALDEQLEELKASETEHFDSWCREMISHSSEDSSDSIALQTAGRLMVLEKENGMLNVSYSDRLARLLSEVRQLQSLGFTIPSKIMQFVHVGQKFYQYGIVLKQVAHFYNTIEQQMLPCQQSMMLDEALAFEKLVLPSAKPNEYSAMNITWDNPEKLKIYIEKLKEAAQKLTDHNRRLRRSHSEIGELVVDLMQIDLIKEEDKWMKKLVNIRQKFADEERFVAVKANMRAWAIHWDRQLYKALQLQFQWGLESLQQQLPTINAQDSDFFVTMVKRNAPRFVDIFASSESLFHQLKCIHKQFEEWILLAQVNFEDLIERHFLKASDWESQLKFLKAKQREAEKIPSQLQFGCIKVATNSLKNSVEDLLKRIYDALKWTLRHSITTALQNIDENLVDGIEKLSNLPQNLDEVAEANQNQLSLARSNKQIREQMAVIEDKNNVLRGVFNGGAGVENIGNTKDQYERFQTLLEGHELVMKEQVEVMKSNVLTRVDKLNTDVERLFSLWNQFKPKAEILSSDDRMALIKAVEFVREKRSQFTELTETKEKIVSDCDNFEVELPSFPLFEEMLTDLESYEANYLLYENFSNELDKLAEQEWILFRSKTYLFDEFLQHWIDKLKSMPATPVSVRLQKDIEDMKEFSACLKFCRGEVLSTDHWLEMFRLLKVPRGTTLEKLVFGDLLKVQQNVVQNVEQLKNLNSRAQGEVTIREAIQELEVWAAQAEFSLVDYKHSNGTMIKIVKEWKNVVNQVKDNQALLQSLKNSPYYEQFKDQTSIWEKRITDLDIYLHSLNEIQRKWVYLEPIFGRGSLPAEAARFNRIDVEFRAILADIARDNRLVALTAKNGMGRTLEQIADQLSRCQRSLNDFLEEKRTAFPRFYFLGDDDLLEILGQSTNPTIIQSHLKKLFQGVDKVKFDTHNDHILAVLSSQGEFVQLSKPVKIMPKVESWLRELSDEIKATLKKLVGECLQEKTLNPAKYPSQVLCLAEQIRFCSDVEQCFNDNSNFLPKLSAYTTQLNGQLEQFSRTVVEDNILQLKLKALILDLVHHIDITEQLARAQNNRLQNGWTWQKQLRFYFIGGNVVARQAGAEIQYTYEYQGNAEGLVHTPLTDKCYLTLTQALSMGLGGNPYGPAGTGKTESVKALARLLGRQVLVFNCDEGIDVQSIGRMFIGLVQCGAWGCFDEFNRLEKNVLSAVSSLIQSIQGAIRSRSGQCFLDNQSKAVLVDMNSALFVTLNPAGVGYGGRQKLPDNLKQLFRPIVMSIPDNEQIAVTLLFAEGYKQAKQLASKLVTTFNLSKEVLSAQQHYDWGLRALKTVLKGCADVMAKERRTNPNTDFTAEKEAKIVVQTLQLNTLSKLTYADSNRFYKLLEDIFPELDKKMIHSEELKEGLKLASDRMKITITERQISKIFELHEQLRQRTGVVIVGPTGAGKTTLWKTLEKALGFAGHPIITYTINPKSMPRARLLGSMDLDTREWSDGIITSASREAIKDTSKPVWIICDGDIDPEWIEALNSVLDDNKLLTMPSGERIQFGDNVNFLFETDDLTHASPATISRMGMIFISDEELDALELVKKSRTALAEQVVFPGLTQLNLKSGVNIYCDTRTDSLIPFTDDFGVDVRLDEMKSLSNKPFVWTARSQAAKDTILTWLNKGEGSRQPFIVLGEDGCGKEKLLNTCFQADHKSSVVTMHCSAQTSKWVGESVPGQWINESDVVGYYDKNLDWIGLENVQLVMSISISPGLERLSHEVHIQIEALAAQMVDTFSKIKSVFRASEQFHYNFTALDLTNWVCSLMRHQLVEPSGRSSDSTLHRCIVYEACRIFKDKLVNLDHKARFDSIVGEHFTIPANHNSNDEIVFCTDFSTLTSSLEKNIVRYEFDVSNFGYVLSDEIVELCLIVDRALTQPGGSLLIAGRSGMGHNSIAKLVAHMHQIKQHDLKEAMKTAAGENEQVVLIVEDYQILQDSFLQYINAVIASGSVPGLFSTQEFDQVATGLRNSALQESYEGSIYSYFAQSKSDTSRSVSESLSSKSLA